MSVARFGTRTPILGTWALVDKHLWYWNDRQRLIDDSDTWVPLFEHFEPSYLSILKTESVRAWVNVRSCSIVSCVQPSAAVQPFVYVSPWHPDCHSDIRVQCCERTISCRAIFPRSLYSVLISMAPSTNWIACTKKSQWCLWTSWSTRVPPSYGRRWCGHHQMLGCVHYSLFIALQWLW